MVETNSQAKKHLKRISRATKAEIEQLAGSPDPNVARTAVRNLFRTNPKEWLSRGQIAHLAKSQDPKHRIAAAIQPLAPAHVLEKLSRDPHPAVILAVASNPKAAPGTLHWLSFSSTDSVALALAGNRASPDYVMEYLSWRDWSEIRAAVASNSATPVNILERLLGDSEPSVSVAAETRLRALAAQQEEGETDAPSRSIIPTQT